jgi:hypothetical protein
MDTTIMPSPRFMLAPEISLALIAAGSVFVADREDGVPHP